MKGTRSATARLTFDGNEYVATFSGLAVPDAGTAGYFIMLFDRAGERGGQLGVRYLDGEQIGYFVFDTDAASQVNLGGDAVMHGDTVTATFPADVGGLAGLDIAQWNAALSLDDADVASCPSGDKFLSPFPG